MFSKAKFLSLAILICTSCATSNNRKNYDLTLDLVDKLIPGRTTFSEIKNVFGSPDGLNDTEENIIWIYLDKKRELILLSVEIDRKSDILISTKWLVREADGENNIDTAKKRYPFARFIQEEVESDNPHVLSDDVNYVDKYQGIQIVFGKNRREVKTISRYTTNPKFNKKPASEKPKIKFQIGGVDT